VGTSRSFCFLSICKGSRIYLIQISISYPVRSVKGPICRVSLHSPFLAKKLYTINQILELVGTYFAEDGVPGPRKRTCEPAREKSLNLKLFETVD